MSRVEPVTERFDTIVIGAGQAGLSVGYHLSRRGSDFVILDDRARIGDAWRERWDSLRLFTPAAFSGLDGLPFPAPSWHFVTKDEMADYLEMYARHFDLPVRGSEHVQRLTHDGERFLARTPSARYAADNVVIAMGSWQKPRIPAFADEIDPGIVQLHSIDYRKPDQLRDGPVLLVGAGNTGSELAMELAPRHRVWMSGRDVGQLPFRIAGLAGRLFLVRFVLRVLFHRILTVDTPIGRRMRPKMLHGSGPLIRVRARDLDRAGVERVPRTAGAREGLPVLDDGRVLEPANVVWCTGFHPGFDWIDLPVLDERGEPRQRSGIAADVPGLFFVGLHFLHSLSSEMIHGVGRDAERIAEAVEARGHAKQRRKPAPDMAAMT